MPAFLKASISAAIALLLASSASRAVLPSLATPLVTMAWSGAALALPAPVTDRVAVRVAGASAARAGRVVRAPIAAGTATAASRVKASALGRRRVMESSLGWVRLPRSRGTNCDAGKADRGLRSWCAGCAAGSVGDVAAVAIGQLVQQHEGAVDMIDQPRLGLGRVAGIQRVDDRHMLLDHQRQPVRAAEQPHEAAQPGPGGIDRR